MLRKQNHTHQYRRNFLFDKGRRRKSKKRAAKKTHKRKSYDINFHLSKIVTRSRKSERTDAERSLKEHLKEGMLSCVACGAVAESIDHVVPRVKGGGGQYTNLLPMCKTCNAEKSDTSMSKYLLTRSGDKDHSYGTQPNLQFANEVKTVDAAIMATSISQKFNMPIHVEQSIFENLISKTYTEGVSRTEQHRNWMQGEVNRIAFISNDELRKIENKYLYKIEYQQENIEEDGEQINKLKGLMLH